MTVHSKDEALMCKIFPSSLGPMVMKWFNGLKANSIDSFKKLTQSFGARFITCSRVPLPLGYLLFMSIRDGETLKAYSDRYWEVFNEIDGSYDDVAISTFKAGLPAEHDLRKFFTGKPVTNVRLLMDRIDKYRRIEKDQLQGKGKAKVIPQESRDSKSDRIQNPEWCIYGERNAFRNHEPFVGNINEVESRIFGPYHTPRSLERAGDGLVSKDEVCCSQLVVSFVDVHLG